MSSKKEMFEGSGSKSSYASFESVTLRFGDTDRMGHINNAVYSTLFEAGRFSFFKRGFDQAYATERKFSLSKVSINFLIEMYFPGTVEVGSKILSVGSSSVTLGQAVFKEEECCAVSESVLVLIDMKLRRSTKFTSDILEIVDTLRLDGSRL
jgi:acyl-CoA thioester hydrolase